VPLVLGQDGRKLSKQHGAAAIDVRTQDAALRALAQAATHLGLPVTVGARPSAGPTAVSDWLAQAVEAWRELHRPAEPPPAVTRAYCSVRRQAALIGQRISTEHCARSGS
jgi:hypothetical protein